MWCAILAVLVVGTLGGQVAEIDKPTDAFLENDKTFILTKDDNYKLQRYVSTILDLTLPKNLKKENYDLRSFHIQAKKNANHWQSSLFPRTVSLAAGISAYSTASSLSFERITKISDDVWDADQTKSAKAKREVQRVLQYLKRSSEINRDKANTIFHDVRVFSQKVSKDKSDVEKLHDVYYKKSQGAAMKTLRAELKALTEKIETLTDEYEHAVIVAATTPTYAWVPWIGWIAAGIVAGVFGAKAVKLKKQINAATDQLNKATKKLNYEEGLVTFAASQLKSLAQIKISLSDVLPVFKKIIGIWGAIRDDIDEILNGQLNLADPSLGILPFQVDIVTELWTLVKRKADGYRLTAYINKEQKSSTSKWY